MKFSLKDGIVHQDGKPLVQRANGVIVPRCEDEGQVKASDKPCTLAMFQAKLGAQAPAVSE